MFRRASLILTALMFCLQPLAAQVGISRAELARVPLLQLPVQNNDSLLVRERAARRPGRPETFAVTVATDLRPATAGRWTDDGTTARWRLRVSSPGAKSLNLGFSRYRLPVGAALYLTAADVRYGPFTAADNADHAQFWSPVLPGDALLIELEVPRESRAAVDLTLSAVNHDFEGVFNVISGSCHLDVACGAADGYPRVDRFRHAIRSVAAYTIDGRDRCTGFLVNNTNQDGRPLFLTANHCGVDAANAPSLVAYWNYENDRCRPVDSAENGKAGNGRLEVFNTGAGVLASSSATDMTLLELDEPVNPAANAYFAGWSAETKLPTGLVAIVHHPNLDEKRISFTTGEVTRSDISGTANAEGNYLRVPNWEVGSTETGSSGAPLFDAEERVVGQLFGGRASCGNDSEDVFGALFRSWTGGGTPSSRLRDWLDPCNTGTRTLAGLEAADLPGMLIADRGCLTVCADEAARFTLALGSRFPDGTEITVSADAGLAVTAPARVDGGASFTLDLDPAGAAAGSYAVTVTAVGGGITDAVALQLDIVTAPPAAPALRQPENEGTDLDPFMRLDWEPVAGAISYDLQFALSADFDGLVADLRDLPQAMYAPNFPLAGSTRYYWRVRSRNACGNGDWSVPRAFTTADRSCLLRRSGVLPVPIDASRPNVAEATLDLTEAIDPSRLEVIVGVDHSYIGDLELRLVSPAGTEIQLLDAPLDGTCAASNLYVIFTASAETTAAAFATQCDDGNPNDYRRVQPMAPFTDLAGESSRGTWRLLVNDAAAEDGGAITDFRLRLCADQTDTRDLGVELLTGPLTACADVGGAVTLQLGTAFTGQAGLRVEAGGQPLDNYTYTIVDDRMEIRFADWSGAPAGTQELSLIAISADGSERRAVTTLTVRPLPVAITPLAAVVDAATITFRWGFSAEADVYRLQFATGESFDEIVREVLTTDRQLTLERDLLPEDFYWRIVAENDCGAQAGPPRSLGSDLTDLATIGGGGPEVSLYPNPTDGTVYVELSAPVTGSGYRLELFTVNGRRLGSWPEATARRRRLDLGHLPAGAYYLRVSDAGGSAGRILFVR